MLVGGSMINSEPNCIAPSINSFVHLGVLQLCGGNKEKEVVLALSSLAPYRYSFSQFSLVLREWSVDVFHFLFHLQWPQQDSRLFFDS